MAQNIRPRPGKGGDWYEYDGDRDAAIRELQAQMAVLLTGDGTVAAPVTAPTVVASSRLTKSSTGQLQIEGAPVRLAGPNIYWLALNDNATGGTGSFVSDTDIKFALDQALAMGANSARIHTLGISVGKTNTMQPTLGQWNDAAVERADFIVAEAGKRAIKLTVPTTDRWDFYHGGLLTLARMVLGASATLTDGYNNTQVRAAHKATLTRLLNHVNRYNGIRWGDDPTLAIWQLGNECYDMPAAFSADIAAHIKSLAPLALTWDGTGASGMHVANAPGLSDPNIDIVSDHLYDDHRMDRTWVGSDAAAAKTANKVFGVDEFDWTDTTNNVTKSRVGGTRADFLSFLESDPRISISYYWSLLVDKANVGTHRDGYELYADAPENTEQAAGRVALTTHARNMIANPTPTAPVVTDTTTSGITDTFTASNGAAPDASKWTVFASTGSSSTVQSNALQLVTGTAGGYNDKVATVSKASPRRDQRVTLDFTPVNNPLRAGFFQVPIRSAAQDSGVGDVPCYRVEVNLGSGVVSLVRRGTNAVALGADFTIPGWGAGVPAHLDFAAIGTTITVTAWTGSTKPSPQVTVTNSDVTTAGYNGIVLNGGSAASSVTVTVDNYTLANA